MAIWKSSVVIHNGLLGGNGTNTWHVRTVGNASFPHTEATGQLQSLTDMLEDFYTGVLSIIGGGTTIDFEALWTSVDESEPIGADVNGWTMTASGSDAIAPPQTCLVVGWRTNSPTKGGRGRTFLGPVKQPGVLNGTGKPSDAARATVEAAGLALIEASDTFGNGAFGVYSRAGTVSEADNGVLRDFTAVRIQNQFGTLRSRRD